MNAPESKMESEDKSLFVSDFDSLCKITPGVTNVSYAPSMKLAAQIALAREFSIVASSASRGDSITTLAEAGINTLMSQDLHTTIAAYIERFRDIECGNLSNAFEDSDDEYEQSTNDPSYQMYPDSEESFLKLLAEDNVEAEDDDDDDDKEREDIEIGEDDDEEDLSEDDDEDDEDN